VRLGLSRKKGEIDVIGIAASPEKCVKSVDSGHVKASSFLLRKSAELKDLRVYIRIQVGTFLVYAFFHLL
jgi:hypothetical protein